MVSHRLEWHGPLNALTRERMRIESEGRRVVDLTRSNPTSVGFDYPHELLAEALGGAARAPYDPDPRGMRRAREALAAWLSRDGDEVSPDDLILTASTSEAYSFLFKLLCDPGDEIVTAKPSYPLLEHLAALESVNLRYYSMHLASSPPRGSRWRYEQRSLEESCTDRTRGIVVVHPNNPTGNYVEDEERSAIATIGAMRRFPLISDEVFLDYALEPVSRRSLARDAETLTFALGGLSKSAALPHWKLGWIRIAGPEAARREAYEALELIADTFLSVATPVQAALARILEIAPSMNEQIRRRAMRNLVSLNETYAALPAVEVLQPDGGWSAVLRLPRLWGDEELAIALLVEESVAVQPGYFFDFPGEGFIVVSLLTEEGIFAEGIRRIRNFLAQFVH